jgi:hypothetical protein
MSNFMKIRSVGAELFFCSFVKSSNNVFEYAGVLFYYFLEFEEFFFQNYLLFNPLQTKRRLLYLKAQSVPRCKHFSSR